MAINVLITSAGTASAINVMKALRFQQEYDVFILAIDVDPTAAGLYLADTYALVPPCSSSEYIPTLLQLCEVHQIQAFYPIYSKEIEAIAANAKTFTDRNIQLLLPSPETVRLCNDKQQMYELANKLGLLTPRSLGNDDTLPFPLFAKPNIASGTSGAFRIDSVLDLEYVKSKFPNLLYQEFIQGKEYTVDILCDRQSNLIAASPRLRLATKAGQSVKGQTVDNPTLVNLCAQLCKAVGMIGACNVQFIQRGEDLFFIEVNPRYAAGGLMLTVHAGANLPFLALKLMLGGAIEPPQISPNLTMLRYWEEVFVKEEQWS